MFCLWLMLTTLTKAKNVKPPKYYGSKQLQNQNYIISGCHSVVVNAPPLKNINSKHNQTTMPSVLYYHILTEVNVYTSISSSNFRKHQKMCGQDKERK